MEEYKLHVLKIDGKLLLDGMPLKGVTRYTLKQEDLGGVAILNICMDVKISEDGAQDMHDKHPAP